MPAKSLTSSDVSNIDRWIENLLDCKPLTEFEVKLLCEKVNLLLSLNYIVYF